MSIKNDKFNIRISSEDKQLVKSKAKSAGITTSDYFIQSALRVKLSCPRPKVDDEALFTLSGIANDIERVAWYVAELAETKKLNNEFAIFIDAKLDDIRGDLHAIRGMIR